MDYWVEQGCPQCGALLNIGEADRFIVCPFCNVRSYILTGGVPRYILPVHAGHDAGSFFWLPYIRLRGSVFVIKNRTISHRIVDTTQLGYACQSMPPTLGFRPQAMKMKRVTAETPGRFLPLSYKASTILAQAARLSDMDVSRGSGLLHRAYIGESLSFIYLPVRKEDDVVFDGVTDILLSDHADENFSGENGRLFQPGWQPDFMACLCPRCGWELDGEAESHVALCSNCDTAWQISARGLEKVCWIKGKSSGRDPFWLPFWKIESQIAALGIKKFADFIRVTKQHLQGKNMENGQSMSFWIPAFKVRPKIFLQTAKRMTLAQNELLFENSGRMVKKHYPVNLPSREARQALKITLAAAALDKKDVFPHLPSLRFTVPSITLAYVPFHDSGHDFVQEQTGVCINRNVLGWGRKL